MAAVEAQHLHNQNSPPQGRAQSGRPGSGSQTCECLAPAAPSRPRRSGWRPRKTRPCARSWGGMNGMHCEAPAAGAQGSMACAHWAQSALAGRQPVEQPRSSSLKARAASSAINAPVPAACCTQTTNRPTCPPSQQPNNCKQAAPESQGRQCGVAAGAAAVDAQPLRVHQTLQLQPIARSRAQPTGAGQRLHQVWQAL